jgi:hypothetical protein
MRARRKATAIAVAAMLAVSIIGSGSAIAADTRILWVGSPPPPSADPPPTPGTIGALKFTPVSAGGTTKIDYLVKSYDNQTISHVILSIPSVSAPTPNGLLTINTVYGPNEDACGDWQKGDTILTCDFGNFGALDERSITVVWDVAQSFDTSTTDAFTASVRTNEQLNPNGSNGQIYEATSGTTLVSPFSANALSTFSTPGQLKRWGTSEVGGQAGNLSTSILFRATDTGNVLNITEAGDGSDLALAYPCPEGLICQPDLVQVTIDSGDLTFGAPYVEWTLTALVPKTYTLSKAFVAHYKTGETIPDWILYNTKPYSCGSNPAATVASKGHCAISFTLGKPDKVTGLSRLEIKFLSDGNGPARY